MSPCMRWACARFGGRPADFVLRLSAAVALGAALVRTRAMGAAWRCGIARCGDGERPGVAEMRTVAMARGPALRKHELWQQIIARVLPYRVIAQHTRASRCHSASFRNASEVAVATARVFATCGGLLLPQRTFARRGGTAAARGVCRPNNKPPAGPKAADRRAFSPGPPS